MMEFYATRSGWTERIEYPLQRAFLDENYWVPLLHSMNVYCGQDLTWPHIEALQPYGLNLINSRKLWYHAQEEPYMYCNSQAQGSYAQWTYTYEPVMTNFATNGGPPPMQCWKRPPPPANQLLQGLQPQKQQQKQKQKKHQGLRKPEQGRAYFQEEIENKEAEPEDPDMEWNQLDQDIRIKQELEMKEASAMASLTKAKLKADTDEMEKCVSSAMEELGEPTEGDKPDATMALKALASIAEARSMCSAGHAARGHIESAVKDIRDVTTWRLQSRVPMGDREAYLKEMQRANGGPMEDNDLFSRLMHSYSMTVCQLFKNHFLTNSKRLALRRSGPRPRRDRDRSSRAPPGDGDQGKQEEHNDAKGADVDPDWLTPYLNNEGEIQSLWSVFQLDDTCEVSTKSNVQERMYITEVDEQLAVAAARAWGNNSSGASPSSHTIWTV